MRSITDTPTPALMRQIEELQGIQKSNRMDTAPWQIASAKLAPLFDEMARRQRAGLL